jgi:hypothetical protein
MKMKGINMNKFLSRQAIGLTSLIGGIIMVISYFLWIAKPHVDTSKEIALREIKEKVEQTRDLETVLYGHPITPTFNKVKKEWWFNYGQAYLDELNKKLEAKIKE